MLLAMPLLAITAFGMILAFSDAAISSSPTPAGLAHEIHNSLIFSGIGGVLFASGIILLLWGWIRSRRQKRAYNGVT